MTSLSRNGTLVIIDVIYNYNNLISGSCNTKIIRQIKAINTGMVLCGPHLFCNLRENCRLQGAISLWILFLLNYFGGSSVVATKVGPVCNFAVQFGCYYFRLFKYIVVDV